LIDIRKLKELVKLMVENDLSELDLRDDVETVVVKRSHGVAAPPQVQLGTAPVPHGQGAAPAGAAPDNGQAEAEDESLHAMVSPMVGTVYSAADPESAPYGKKGADVDPETLASCYRSALELAAKHELRSVAVPVGGAEHGLRLEEEITIAVEEIERFLRAHPRFERVVVCCPDSASQRICSEQFGLAPVDVSPSG